jgi:glycosyltransferase involved in cell wall biosynthesis
MRILLIMDPFIRVPPQYYGGIERVIADIAEIFAKEGHEVTLLAAPGSKSPGRLITYGREGEWTCWSNIRNLAVVSVLLQRESRRHDVIHNFGRLLYLLTVLRQDRPKVQTYMRPVSHINIRQSLRLGARRLHFTAVSDFIRRGGEKGGGQWNTIYNCALVHQYHFCGSTNPRTAPLAFLGRLERCKGLHSAIAVARRAERKLRIAGNISTLPQERDYFEKEIRPLIDGEHVEYLGPIDNEAKNELLASAAALLLPIEWDEPFPVVLPEALLCGTPVMAFRKGGVPEGIEECKTGFVCDSVEEMATLVNRLSEIDRKDCRAEGERRFSASVIARNYLELYCQALASSRSAEGLQSDISVA